MPSDDHLAEEVLGSVYGEAVEELAGRNKGSPLALRSFSGVRGL
jgi:hypothetical protein